MDDPQSPDPSPVPAPGAQAAAIAAMRREWSQIREGLLDWSEETAEHEEAGEATRRAALLRDFFARHRGALLAAGVQDEKLDLTELKADLARFLHSDAAYHDAEEKLLQMTAMKAQTEQDLNVALLEHFEALEKIPQEEWEAMPDHERGPLETALEHFRRTREDMLGTLPIALRREWESRLPPE
jgi:hypothetical protein